MICHAADLQSVHRVFASNTAEIGKSTFANRFDENGLTIFRAENEVVM